jgi:hypothetical protein
MHTLKAKLIPSISLYLILIVAPIMGLFATEAESVVVIMPPSMPSAYAEDASFLGELIQNEVSTVSNLTVVDRSSLFEYIGELALTSQGVATPDSNQIGQVLGADFFVTTRLYQAKKSDGGQVAIRVTDIATTRTKGASFAVENVSELDLFVLAKQVGTEVSQLISQLAANNRSQAFSSDTADLPVLPADWPRPSVAIFINEQHIDQAVIDLASEVRLIKRLLGQGFPVIDLEFADAVLLESDSTDGASAADPVLQKAVRVAQSNGVDVLIYGEGVSQSGGRVGEFVSCRARVEVRAVDTKTSRIIFTSSATRGASDTAEVTAAKTALGYAADAIAAELITALAQAGTK